MPVKIYSNRPVETQYDLLKSQEGADRSEVANIVLSDLIREKLISELSNNSTFEDVRKKYEYYRGFFQDMYQYGRSSMSGPFWGSSQVMAEKIAPLTGIFLEALSRISPIDSSTAEKIQLYEAVKNYLPVDTDRNKILSTLTERIISTSSFDDALKFLEKEGLDGNIDMKTVDQFIEKRVFTYQDYLKCKQTVSSIVENLITKPNSEIGTLAIVDTLFDVVQPPEMVKILEGMIPDFANYVPQLSFASLRRSLVS